MSSIQSPAPITFECTECGVGHYHRVSNVVDVYGCCRCEHVVAHRDFDLETGETLTLDAAGRLAYLPADD